MMRLIDADALKSVLKDYPIFLPDKKQWLSEVINASPTVHDDDQRLILSWCGSLEEAKLNGEFEHKPEDSYFLKQVKTICQLATMDLKG